MALNYFIIEQYCRYNFCPVFGLTQLELNHSLDYRLNVGCILFNEVKILCLLIRDTQFLFGSFISYRFGNEKFSPFQFIYIKALPCLLIIYSSLNVLVF